MILNSNTDLHFFHDAKMGLITYDYKQKLIALKLTFDTPSLNITDVELLGSSVISVQLNGLEPWGKGVYINEVTLEDKTTFQRLSILINSGDQFVIDAKEFELNI